jgi:predicted transcriptional regulator
MEQLPPELMRLPLNALDVFRFIGQSGLEQAEAEVLAEGSGMSQRAIGKAIRGLVTQGYLNMDEGYVYHVTDKGRKAVKDVMDYDAANPQTENNQQVAISHQPLVLVVNNPFSSHQTSSIQVGFERPLAIQDASQVVLRFSSTTGTISPSEVSLELEPQQIPHTETYYTPDGASKAVRIRVEAMQIVNMMDVHPAGGMFFDVAIDHKPGHLQAWYGTLELSS